MALHEANFGETVVRLSATGVGSTLRASCDMGRMYLGNHFTEQPFESTFSIENHGRKPRTLVWSRLRNKVLHMFCNKTTNS